MAVLDTKWQVPENYDIAERDIVLPPPRNYTGTQPMLGVLSVRALEDQATDEGALSLLAWQVMAGGWSAAEQTIERLANRMEMQGLELLMLGHAYLATGVGAGAGFEVAQRARKILKQPVTPLSIDASLLLAVTALPYGAERVKTLLEMLEPELQHGTDEHRAVHALLRAAAEPDPARLDEAFTLLGALSDDFGQAQCALLAYSLEAAAEKRPDVLRGYLEHAIYRYEADGRPEWAARTITHALVPLLADEIKAPAADIATQLGRATTLGVQARSEYAVESAFRVAAKLGFGATVTTLSQFEPPTFAKRDPSAPVAEPKPEPKKKATTKRSSKKKAASSSGG